MKVTAAVISSHIAWGSFVPTAFLISSVPGSSQALIVRNAVRQGFRDALAGLAGRLSAFAVLILLVAAGLGSALTASTVSSEAASWLGVAYLTWIGTGALLTPNSTVQSVSPSLLQSRRSLGRQEFLVAITNPKALLLFAVILPRFISDGHQGIGQLLYAGVAYLAVEATVGTGYALLGERLRGMSSFTLTDRRLDRITGLVFLGLALWLALAGLQ
jgi:threonine/homoserine/homoserine lactone efflux protein